jgi:hypothetical protein
MHAQVTFESAPVHRQLPDTASRMCGDNHAERCELSAEVPKFPPDVTGGALRSAGVHTLRHQNSVNAGASDSESQYWRLRGYPLDSGSPN